MPADVIGPRPRRAASPGAEPPDVVIPVHGNARAVAACLDSVLASVRGPSRIMVVDDASPDPEVAALLARFGRSRRVQVLRLRSNGGFPAAANAGIAACAGRDVVLLNSDTLVPPGWLERLRDAAHGAPDIGTATPLSNHATILSYPGDADRNPQPTTGGHRGPGPAGAGGERRNGGGYPGRCRLLPVYPARLPGRRWACCARTYSPRAMARRTISACAPAIWAGAMSRYPGCSSAMPAAGRSDRPAATCRRATRRC